MFHFSFLVGWGGTLLKVPPLLSELKCKNQPTGHSRETGSLKPQGVTGISAQFGGQFNKGCPNYRHILMTQFPQDRTSQTCIMGIATLTLRANGGKQLTLHEEGHGETNSSMFSLWNVMQQLEGMS